MAIIVVMMMVVAVAAVVSASTPANLLRQVWKHHNVEWVGQLLRRWEGREEVVVGVRQQAVAVDGCRGAAAVAAADAAVLVAVADEICRKWPPAAPPSPAHPHRRRVRECRTSRGD